MSSCHRSERVPPRDYGGENAEELRLIANAVPALLSYLDVEARYVWCNEGYRRAFGYTAEQIRGKHVREVLGIAGWESVRPHLTRALSGEPVTFENRVLLQNGALYEGHVWFAPHRDANGAVCGVVVMVNDVTDQKATERALRKSEQMLERSQSSAHVGSWEVDLTGDGWSRPEGVKWSAETFRIFGYEPGSLKPNAAAFVDRIHPDDRDLMRSRADRFLKRAEPYENEYRIVRPDGSVRVLHSWVDFESDAAGVPIRAIGTLQDITDRKRAEQELRDADRRKDEFLAMLSHELRNPLAPILSAVEIIEQARPEQRELRATYQAVITRQVLHMKRLLDDLLDVARVSQGKIELRRERVELTTLLLQAVEVSRPMIVDKGQTLAIALSKRVAAGRRRQHAHRPGVRQPDQQRRQVHRSRRPHHAELAGRAWRGGRLRPRRRNRDGPRPPGARLRPLRAGDPSGRPRPGWARHRPHDGADAGQDARRIGGGAQRGGRTGQRVRCPVAARGGAAGGARGARGEWCRYRRLPLRVLVVDDNIDAARGLGQLLALSGHRVTLAHDGPGALEAAAALPPQLVLLDIGLPGMDGYTVAARLRAAGHDRAALVAVTGYGRDDDLRRSNAAGFDRHLVKPIDGAALRKLLAEMSDRFGSGTA